MWFCSATVRHTILYVQLADRCFPPADVVGLPEQSLELLSGIIFFYIPRHGAFPVTEIITEVGAVLVQNPFRLALTTIVIGTRLVKAAVQTHMKIRTAQRAR